jgi:hypothetical protein
MPSNEAGAAPIRVTNIHVLAIDLQNALKYPSMISLSANAFVSRELKIHLALSSLL